MLQGDTRVNRVYQGCNRMYWGCYKVWRVWLGRGRRRENTCRRNGGPESKVVQEILVDLKIYPLLRSTCPSPNVWENACDWFWFNSNTTPKSRLFVWYHYKIEKTILPTKFCVHYWLNAWCDDVEEKGKFCPSLETVLSEIQIKSLGFSYNMCHKNVSFIVLITRIAKAVLQR